MNDDAPLRELLARKKPNAALTACWILLLEDHLDRLQAEAAPAPENGETTGVRPSDASLSSSPSPGRRTRSKPPPLQLEPTMFGIAGAPEIDDVRQNDLESLQQDRETPDPQRIGRSARTRQLPPWVTLAITLLIPLTVAITNNIIVWTDGFVMELKFDVTQEMIQHDGFGFGLLTFTAINAALAFVTGCLVCLVAPICAGSGLPEAKSYLNGNHIRGLFKVKVFFVRVIGIIMATAAGFPIGREGPMVAIGGCLGHGVVHVLALPWFRHWVKVDSEVQSSALLVDEERFAHAKRIGFTLGGAAGIACAFDAPIGGILYMFEEATLSTWPPALTFRAFACTLCGCLISMGLFNLAGHDVNRLLIYMDADEYAGSWDWQDVPLFILLAAFVGLLSAIFTRMLVFVWTFRQKKHKQLQNWQPYAKIAEVTAYAVICSVIFFLMPLVTGCSAPAQQKHKIFADGHVDDSLQFVQHACHEGKVNEVATLLLKGTEGSLKHLFSRNTEALNVPSIAMTLSLYMLLNIGMAGLAVPMGNFIPSMLIGALVGRLVGEEFARKGMDPLADAGVYAMVGSAAMLGGFTQMTIAIVVILAEAGRDLSLVSPLMLSISVSHIVTKCINQHGFDEVLILRKGVPFLEAELPREMDNQGVVAADLCEDLPADVQLPPEASIEAVQRALERKDVVHFPVISDGVCIGLTSRARLEAAMRAMGAVKRKDESTPKVLAEDDPGVMSDGATMSERCEPSDEELDIDGFIGGLCTPTNEASKNGREFRYADVHEAPPKESLVPVHRLMDSAPYTLLEEMPAPRFYPLFTRTGTSAACVVSSRGEFRGLLSRVNLISAASSAWRPPKKSRTNRYEPLS